MSTLRVQPVGNEIRSASTSSHLAALSLSPASLRQDCGRHDSLRRAVRSRLHLPRGRAGRPRRRTSALAAADVVIVGAPFDGGTSHRPGTRFGPMAIRQACYLPVDGSRPHMALRVDALQDLAVVDAGDVEMYSGDVERVDQRASRRPSTRSPAAGAVPIVLGGDHTIAYPDRHRRRPPPRQRQGVDDPLRRACRHRRHHVRLALRARAADAAADRVRRAARRPVPADRPARLLARARDADLDGRPEHAVLRDDRDRRARARRLPDRGVRRSRSTSATAVFLSVDVDVCDPGHAPGTGTPEPGGLHARAAPRRRTPDLHRAARRRESTSSRCRRRTTTQRSPPTWPTGSASRLCQAWRHDVSAPPTTRPDRCSRAAVVRSRDAPVSAA